MLEFGLIAPFLWLWWTGSATWSCFKIALKAKGFNGFPLAFALFWYAFYLLVLGTWGGIYAFPGLCYECLRLAFHRHTVSSSNFDSERSEIERADA